MQPKSSSSFLYNKNPLKAAGEHLPFLKYNSPQIWISDVRIHSGQDQYLKRSTYTTYMNTYTQYTHISVISVFDISSRCCIYDRCAQRSMLSAFHCTYVTNTPLSACLCSNRSTYNWLVAVSSARVYYRLLFCSRGRLGPLETWAVIRDQIQLSPRIKQVLNVLKIRVRTPLTFTTWSSMIIGPTKVRTVPKNTARTPATTHPTATLDLLIAIACYWQLTVSVGGFCLCPQS